MEGKMEEKTYYKAKFLRQNNKMGKGWLRDLAILLWAIGALLVGMAGCLPSGKLGQTITVTATATVPLDSDGDGIPDVKEMGYGTDPHAPNPLLAYALKVLPEVEALKFKEGELNENSRSLVDLYASLPQEKRDSREVNDVLTQILSDKEVFGSEKSLFDDRFVKPTLPSVDLSWVPTREKLDKVYDIEVTFVARDDKTPIAYAELRFVPVEYDYMIQKYGMRPEDYPKVFPPDKERVFVLKPVDGKFDSLEEKFSIAVTDIVGGREYKIVALVKDLAGNEKIVEVKTPYIRQFENVAKTDDITVAAFYYNWYTPGYDIPKDLPDKPLLGLYYSDDNVVFNKHVDWATGHGIDVFVFPWFYEGHEVHRRFEKNTRSELFNQIKFSFISTYVDRLNQQPPYNFDDKAVRDEFINNIKYLIAKYFSLPNVWTINGKPVVVLWSSHEYKSTGGGIEHAFKVVREQSHAFLGKDLYIVGNIPVVWNESEVVELIKNSNAIYDYEPLPLWLKRDMSLNEAVPYAIERTKIWIEIVAGKYKKNYIPTISPGFDNRYDYRPHPAVPVISRSLSGFQLYISETQKLPNPLGIIFLTSFNELFEGTQLEPTCGYEYSYLNVLKQIISASR
jgi:hypothetical protein